jgi:hypothetical protein
MRPVLVSDGGIGQSISTLGAVRALAAAGHEAHVAMSHPLAVAGWSRHCARRVHVPTVDDVAGYTGAMRALADSGDYETVLLASDAALLALGWSGAALVDKAEVGRRTTAAGFSTAHEEVFADGADLLAHAADVRYPVAVKPVEKHDSISLNVWRADGPADLAPAQGYDAPLLVQEWLPGALQGMSGVVWGGRLRAALHQTYPRTWPRLCGVASCAVTIEPDPALEERVLEVMRGHEGLFNVQYIGDHLIDINPRVYGSVVVSSRAGANFLDVVTRLAAGEDVGRDAPLRGRVGVPYRWVEGDLRSILDGKRSGALGWPGLARALRPTRHTVHADVSLRDPVPTLARITYAARSRRHHS